MGKYLNLSELGGEFRLLDNIQIGWKGRNDGKLAEQAVNQTLTDLTGIEFRSVQNASGHGLDHLGIDHANKTIWSVETKSSYKGIFKYPKDIVKTCRGMAVGRSQKWSSEYRCESKP